MTEGRQFKFSEKSRADAKSSGWIFLCFVLGIVVAVLLSHDSWITGQLLFFACTAVFFLAQSIYIYRFLKNSDRSTAAIDDYGIQPLDPRQHLARLSWNALIAIRVHPVLKRLELIGPPGFRLTRLEYQLEGFKDIVNGLFRKCFCSPSFSAFSLSVLRYAALD